MQPLTRRDGLTALPRMRLADLEEGDLIFFSSSGGLQTLCDLVGGIWIHVAIVLRVDGELRTAEAGTPAHIGSRRVADLFAAYESIGVARPALPDRCRQGAAALARGQLAGEVGNVYPWDDFLTAAVILLTRKNFPESQLPRLEQALADVADRFGQLNENSRTCSYFIHQLFEEADGACDLTVPVLIGPDPLDVPRDPALGVPTLDEMIAAPPDARTGLLARYSLLELAAAGPDGVADAVDGPERAAPTSRGMNGSWTTPDQFLRFVRASSHLLLSLVNQPLGRPLRSVGLDGRWVTPTDLWDSPQVGYQALLEPS